MGRARRVVVGGLLALPLVVVGAWIAAGLRRPSAAPTDAPAPLEPGREGDPVVGGRALPGFPPPDADLPADRLHERVDGAEDYLRAQGCTRLLVWDLEDHGAELEVFYFRTAEAASRVFARDVGDSRSAGPGDEGWSGGGSVFFRRGSAYVKLVSVSAPPGTDEGLLGLAARVDRAIQDTEPRSS